MALLDRTMPLWVLAGVLAAFAECSCFCADKPSETLPPNSSGAGEAASSPASAESERSKTIRHLIELLGSEQYGERSQATRELQALGRPAIEALQYASEDEDPEIRARATNLLIEMRGRGFMGVMLQEYWDGQPFGAQILQQPDDEEAEGGDAPVQEEKPAQATANPSAIKPPPVLVATEVQKGLNRPAEVAGIKDGDKFVSVAGRPVHGLIDLLRLVIMAGPGKRIMVVVEREGKKITLFVDLMCNPEDHPKIDLMSEVPPAVRSPAMPGWPKVIHDNEEPER